MTSLTQERVQQLLDYDENTGEVRWRTARGRAKEGDLAGFLSSGGYLDIRIDGEQRRLHRVIYLYVHGQMPVVVDHVNGNKRDNRLKNLRGATQRENLRNAARFSHNSSGIAGVFWNTGKQKWTAKIKVDGKSIHLGHFANKEEAARARKLAERQHGFSDTHGRDPLTIPPDKRFGPPVGEPVKAGKMKETA